MNRRPAALAAALLLTAAAPPQPTAPAQGSGGWNRARVAAMTPEAITRLLFGDAAGIMYLEQIPGPDRMLGGLVIGPDLPWLRFLTAPRATRQPGICETDRATVDFAAPAGDWPFDSKGVVRRIRIDGPYYFVSDGKRATEDNPFAQDEKTALDGICRETDPRKVKLIYSDTDYAVSSGLASLKRLIQAARRGRSPVPLACSDELGRQQEEKACLAAAGALRPEEFFSVASADGCGMGERGTYCTRLSLLDQFGRETNVNFVFPAGTTVPLRIELSHPPSLEAIM